MKVRVKARGHFKGQVVDVLEVDKKPTNTWYKLDVTWKGQSRHSWFEAYEVEIIKEEDAQPEPESEAH